MSKFYSFALDMPKGQKLELKDLQGKVVLVVNVASKWCASRDRMR